MSHKEGQNDDGDHGVGLLSESILYGRKRAFPLQKLRLLLSPSPVTIRSKTLESSP